MVGTRVDLEQEVALLDERAVLEVDGLEVARDACAHFDALHGLGASGVLVPLDDLAFQRLRHGPGRRRRRRGRRRFLATGGEEQGYRESSDDGNTCHGG